MASKTTAEPTVLTFEFEKETPGTHRFSEVLPNPDAEPVIGALYVKKAALKAMGNPTTLTVTVEAG